MSLAFLVEHVFEFRLLGTRFAERFLPVSPLDGTQVCESMG